MATNYKKLYRSKTNKQLTGLCGGIADYFEVDASLIRLGWIIVTILTGIVPGIIAYFVATLVIPMQA